MTPIHIRRVDDNIRGNCQVKSDEPYSRLHWNLLVYNQFTDLKQIAQLLFIWQCYTQLTPQTRFWDLMDSLVTSYIQCRWCTLGHSHVWTTEISCSQTLLFRKTNSLTVSFVIYLVTWWNRFFRLYRKNYDQFNAHFFVQSIVQPCLQKSTLNL